MHLDYPILDIGVDPFRSHPECNMPEVQLFIHHCQLSQDTSPQTSSLFGSTCLDFQDFTSRSFPVVLGSRDRKFLEVILLSLINFVNKS
jgi:hypothetical protein